MNIWSKSLLFTALLATIAIQSSQATRTKAEQTQLDLQLYDAVTYKHAYLTEDLLSRKANPNADVSATIPADRYFYTYARRPLVRALYNLECCIKHGIHPYIQEHSTIIGLLLQRGANPNVTLSATTDARAFENHVKFAYLNKPLLASKLAPAYKTLELLLAHGATTDIDSYTFPCGIHGLAEDNPELQRILEEYAAKLKNEIANTTPLSHDPAGVVVEYVVGEPT